MLDRVATLAIRRGRAVLVAAVVLALAGAVASLTLFARLTAGGLTDSGSESGRATSVLSERFGHAQPNLTVLVTTPRGVDDPSAAAAGKALTEQLAREPGIRDVTSYWTSGNNPQLRSKKGDKALILANVAGSETAVNERLATLVPRIAGDHGGVHARVGGYAMYQKEVNEQSQRDAEMGEAVAFPLTVVALVVVYGSLVAAMLPLAVAVVTLLAGMGVIWIVAGLTDISVFSLTVVTLLGLGLAIDYSLLMVSRYREELGAGRPVPDAVRATMASAGRTVVFSAVTVTVALASLAVFPLPAIRSMAIGGVATTLLAALCSVTILPALFARLGHRLERRHRREQAGAEDEHGFWHRLASFVMRHPVPPAAIAVLILVLLGLPFLRINLATPDQRQLPPSASARAVAETIRDDFPTGLQDVVLAVLPHATGGPQTTGAYAAKLSSLDGVAAVTTVTGTYTGGAQTAPATPANVQFGSHGAVFVSIVPKPGSPDLAERIVREVRATPAPSEVLVGGNAAMALDANAAMERGLPAYLIIVCAVMLFLLFLLTGSVLVPVIALLLSALSLTATFGALVWIFQDGHLSGLLGGFTVTGSIPTITPPVLFALAFGLAMDYQVFLLARIREEYERTGRATAAVASGLDRVGRIVTAAAVLISIVFLAATTSGITFMKSFGVGLPLAVLMDATLIRGVLLPAAMRLGGRATWWAPAPLRRFHARFAIRESGETEVRHTASVR